MLAFSRWLAETPLSEAVQNILWIIPAVQTVHILSLAILLTSVGAVALASFGRLGRAVAMADMAGRFAPWVWGAFATLLATGTILIVGEPERELINWAFWIKVPLLVAAAALTAVFLSRLAGGGERAAARGPALVLVLLWGLVIVFGRLIAYAQIALA
jgi:hypothetical protein